MQPAFPSPPLSILSFPPSFIFDKWTDFSVKTIHQMYDLAEYEFNGFQSTGKFLKPFEIKPLSKNIKAIYRCLEILEPTQAEKLADIILKTFNSHEVGESELLGQWIGYHTKEYGGDQIKGVAKNINRLFIAIAGAKKCPDAFSSEYKENHIALSNIVQIHSSAGYYTKKFKFPDEIMKQIVTQFVEDHSPQLHKTQHIPMLQNFSPEDIISLEKTSHSICNIAVQAYKGPLFEKNIKTAQEVIDYVKKFGDSLEYIDISFISFNKDQFEKLLENLPKLNTLIARYCILDHECMKVFHLCSNDLITLDLSGIQIQSEGIQAFASCLTHLNHLENLNLEFGNHSEENVQVFASCLPYLTNLKKFKLEYNVSAKSIEIFASCIINLTNLKKFNLVGRGRDNVPADHEDVRILMDKGILCIRIWMV